MTKTIILLIIAFVALMVFNFLVKGVVARQERRLGRILGQAEKCRSRAARGCGRALYRGGTEKVQSWQPLCVPAARNAQHDFCHRRIEQCA